VLYSNKSLEIYNKLIDDDIKNSVGSAHFSFLDIETKINDKSPYGYIFQGWLEQWFKRNNISYSKPSNSQDFPDFYLNLEDKKADLLEVKVFDGDKSPNFDIADFTAYAYSLEEKAYKLDSDYIIFAYILDGAGNLSIKDLWMKKVWEICGPSDRYAIKCQVKKQVIHKIRPATWYSQRSTFKPFNSVKKFLEAMESTLKIYPQTTMYARGWIDRVRANYLEHTSKELF